MKICDRSPVVRCGFVGCLGDVPFVAPMGWRGCGVDDMEWRDDGVDDMERRDAGTGRGRSADFSTMILSVCLKLRVHCSF